MILKKYTVTTQLHEKHNADLIAYMEASRALYGKALRETFYAMRGNPNFKKHRYNAFLQKKYGILKRTAGSILEEAKGRFHALLALKKHERAQLRRKIKALEEDLLPKLMEKRQFSCEKLRGGEAVSLSKHRALRRQIVAKKAHLHRMKQRLSNLDYEIASQKVKCCFGTKKLLQSGNRFAFRNQRDGQMVFIGCKLEPQCNQNLQLHVLRKKNQLLVKLRRDFGGFKDAEKKDRYLFGQVYFRNHVPYLKEVLQTKNTPLSFRILRKKGRYFLSCSFEIAREEGSSRTRTSHGTLGLDFNKGFVALAETNEKGHLLRLERFPYRFGEGNKTKADLQALAAHLVEESLDVGKDLCLESLDFANKKASAYPGKNKTYNQMLHSFPYRIFSEAVQQIAHRKQAGVQRVNPAWTSRIAKEVYCFSRKLNIHSGAAFVIARRGQGLVETLPKKIA